MSLIADLRVLYHLVVKPVRGTSHAERLESFYAGQAPDYDRFRRRLLHGRRELFQSIDIPADGIWVDMGAGTGANLEFLGDAAMRRLRKLYLVDLSPSLLAMARQRVQQGGWTNVETVLADATKFVPTEGPADVVTFSYSLTMIPDWFAALDNARSLLRSGGQIGVVDFYVSRKYPTQPDARHSWLTRHFWPVWLASDNVFPTSDHLPYLRQKFQAKRITEHRAKVPYFPFARVPYYSFLGVKE
jgi:S-adenosylmethionine-diacylgycerolhomoserine-N-methlytransferase